jgi:leucyl/phenylalanyl-tRNA---protein transferase
VHLLNADTEDIRFPPVELASREGLLAVGGDLSVPRLLEAYRRGIFPWYNEGQPILWWSPDPRTVLLPEHLKLSRSLRKSARPENFRVSFDRCFADVMRACAGPRRGQANAGTWITAAMLDAYIELHRQGYAHSVETWRDEKLVGGLYGVALGGAFFGESMFSHATDASKVALVYATRQLQRWDFSLIDCQLPSEHLYRMGAQSISRKAYLGLLEAALAHPQRPPSWHFDSDLIIG